MLKQPTSQGRLRRLNARQRKKLHVGEFIELVFEAKAVFHQPLDEAAYTPWLDAFIDFVEARQLCVGGMGGMLPLSKTDGIISNWHPGSATEADRQAVLDWLKARPEVAAASVGELVDGWHYWG